MNILAKIAFASALFFTALQGAALAHEIKVGDIVISDPWARQSPMSAKVAAGFLTITNEGKADDKLVKASAEITPMVQIHDMKMVGDVMKMVEMPEGISIPAGATVELKPKSLHIMFMDVKDQPKAGEVIKGTLTFEKAGTVAVEFAVKEPGADMN